MPATICVQVFLLKRCLVSKSNVGQLLEEEGSPLLYKRRPRPNHTSTWEGGVLLNGFLNLNLTQTNEKGHFGSLFDQL